MKVKDAEIRKTEEIFKKKGKNSRLLVSEMKAPKNKFICICD